MAHCFSPSLQPCQGSLGFGLRRFSHVSSTRSTGEQHSARRAAWPRTPESWSSPRRVLWRACLRSGPRWCRAWFLQAGQWRSACCRLDRAVRRWFRAWPVRAVPHPNVTPRKAKRRVSSGGGRLQPSRRVGSGDSARPAGPSRLPHPPEKRAASRASWKAQTPSSASRHRSAGPWQGAGTTAGPPPARTGWRARCARSGDTMPPWGRPVTGWSPWPSVSPPPAVPHGVRRLRPGRSARLHRRIASRRA